MEISAKELRGKPGRVIEQAANGTEVIITLRGKKVARLVPFNSGSSLPEDSDDELFGLWRDRAAEMTVDEQVRMLRKGRTF